MVRLFHRQNKLARLEVVGFGGVTANGPLQTDVPDPDVVVWEETSALLLLTSGRLWSLFSYYSLSLEQQ